MRTSVAGAFLSLGLLLAAQDAQKPGFEIASIHLSSNQAGNRPRRASGAHGQRYEVDGYTIVDFLRFAYGYQPDHIVGGPSWIEMTRYDVLAKIPPDSSPDAVKQMVQSLLAERFGVKVHEDTRPVPAWVLAAGKKPLLKEATGGGETGCKPEGAGPAPGPPGPPGPGGSGGPSITTLMTSTVNTNGQSTTTSFRITDGMVTYNCRNLTMEAFVGQMRMMFGSNLGPNPVREETGLKGSWNFDLHYAAGLPIPGADQGQKISFADAIEKQLGLKLEKRDFPAKVLVVDSANQTPTPDPPGVAEALPAIALPTEFEIASVKLSEPVNGPGGFALRFNMTPAGRFTADKVPLRFLIDRAFNIFNNREKVQGGPELGFNDRFDIAAKVTLPPGVDGNDPELQATLVRNLLVERFGMKYHSEQREVTAYALVAGKAKLKKADPATRAHCSQGNAMTGAPPGSRALTCENVTMAQFALQLQGMNQDLSWPVEDLTKLDGGYDVTLTYNPFTMPAGFGRGGDASQPADPSGTYTIFEAIEKQLGLKLEKVKRTEQVFVIDHIDQKPTEN